MGMSMSMTYYVLRITYHISHITYHISHITYYCYTACKRNAIYTSQDVRIRTEAEELISLRKGLQYRDAVRCLVFEKEGMGWEI